MKPYVTHKATGTINMYKNILEDELITYVTRTVKNKIGKSFFIPYGSDSYINLMEFVFKKYDKKLESRLIPNIRSRHDIYKPDGKIFRGYKEGIYPIAVTKNTFIIITVGELSRLSNMSIVNQKRYSVGDNRDGHPYDMNMFVFGRSAKKLIRYIEKICTKTIVDSAKMILYSVSGPKRYGDRPSNYDKEEGLRISKQMINRRNLNTLFFSNDEIKKICNHIDKFNQDKSFYNSRQLLYKTGILFKGEPGTGKSSLVKAIASEYNRDIININISDIETIDFNTLTVALNNQDNDIEGVDNPFIVLFEDIDTLFLNRTDGESDKDSAIIINKLLQFLDSNSSPTNVIFIATTNHPERLDEALLRRFDLKIDIGPLNREVALKYLESFEIDKESANSILDEIDSKSKRKGIFNQKTLQDYAISNKQNKSIEEIKNIYKFDEEEEEEATTTPTDSDNNNDEYLAPLDPNLIFDDTAFPYTLCRPDTSSSSL